VKQATAREPAACESKQQAEKLSQHMLDLVRQERETLLAQAAVEAAGLREQARQEGYDEALRQKVDDLTRCIRQTEQAVEDFASDSSSFLPPTRASWQGLHWPWRKRY
jgi:cell division septum initiation protein DivIVA